jgi:hypothetical protein
MWSIIAAAIPVELLATRSSDYDIWLREMGTALKNPSIITGH